MLLAAAVVLLAIGFALIASREISRAGRAERDSAARHRFLAAFDRAALDRAASDGRGAGGAGVPSELLVQTYDVFAARAAAPPHAVLRPAARLRDDLGLTPADVEDAALLVTTRCEAHLPHGRDLDALVREATTVEDFVHFLAPFVRTAPMARAG